MKIEELKDKKIAILGFGVEGKATLSFLKHFYPDKEVGILDQKDSPDYLEKQKDYDLIIKTAGIPKRLVTQDYTTATNIFFANTKRKIIGVTGTKGKSTTTSLIYEILKASGKDVELVGNIGEPMLLKLIEKEPEERIYVCELSSYQLEDLKYSPHVSVFINFFPDHLDYHEGLDAYWSAKANILSRVTENDFFVFNPHFEKILELSKQTKAKVVPMIESLPFDRSKIPLLGEHNVDNVKIAITVSRIFDVDDKSAEEAIVNFKSLPHRLEKVGTFSGITFYDDAISTTPESTIAGIDAVGNTGTIFLGGTDRGYDFGALAKKIFEKGIKNVVIFPDSGARILKCLKDEAGKLGKQMPRVIETRDMKEAVDFAYENTPNGEICLLSTASPSYSVWKNFEEKGSLFQRFVQEHDLK
jgi:UDP-N-acetylmuramoylalanine--D-glutamate ligase